MAQFSVFASKKRFSRRFGIGPADLPSLSRSQKQPNITCQLLSTYSYLLNLTPAFFLLHNPNVLFCLCMFWFGNKTYRKEMSFLFDFDKVVCFENSWGYLPGIVSLQLCVAA